MQNISAEDFYKETHFNQVTKHQLWMSIVTDAHDSVCNCWHPFAHMLANIFPPGHKDRNLTINQILERDLKETWPSGGDADASHGLVAGEDTGGEQIINPEEKEEEYIEDEEITELLKAADVAATRFSRLLLKEKEKIPTHTPRPEKRKQRDPEMSPLTLRRKYMARATTRLQHPPAPTAAAPAAAVHQAEPPNINCRPESKTEKSSAPNRVPRLTRFKPGFERETENELAQAFKRPPRMFKEDAAFYPWLPRFTPLVNFHLNFKF
ncbi:hypothetical protein [Torque teno midi virus 6]|uniref:Hepatitis TT virus Orf2/Gyrovirus Vp2 N-terminal domain-containing protein n=2 Tax=Torque teno midi virus 6 TaxID=2065047 RepID=A7VLV7_9VIRU|nr:hypothetical protein [Torque teno midi virus 6]BAF76078.1 hypothetical protein [Torque teno midi virus 6]